MVEPEVRFRFGIAAFFGSAAVFLVTLRLLPEPAAIEGDLFLMTLLMGGTSVFASGFVLSIVLIASAVWQAFKRRKYFRSNVS